MELARRYLGPPRRGVEIGASALNPFDGVVAWNVDYFGGQVFQAAQERIAGAVAPVHAYGLADRLPLAEGCVDFVLASHVLEHVPDTIRCLWEWSRVVKDGGIVFMIVPHKDRTFDAERPRTELEHHLADLALGMTIGRSPMVPTSHYHVWVTEDVVRLIVYLNEQHCLDWEVVDVEDVDSKVGSGFTVVARRRSCAGPPPPPLETSGSQADVAFHFWTLDLPFQVAGRTTEHVVPGAELRDPGDLPRGPYRVVPIEAGFPPRARAPRRVLVGGAIEAPAVDRVERRGDRLRFRGRALCATTWLEADFGDGRLRQHLPAFVDGGLEVDCALLPPHAFAARAVNPPPGGGASELREVVAHLDAPRDGG